MSGRRIESRSLFPKWLTLHSYTVTSMIVYEIVAPVRTIEVDGLTLKVLVCWHPEIASWFNEGEWTMNMMARIRAAICRPVPL